MKNEWLEDVEETIEDEVRIPKWLEKCLLICAFAIICLIIGGIIGWNIHAHLHEDKEISVDYITGKLEDASELTTQKITYTACVQMEKGSIPVITKRGFVMYYNATLSAGVDLKDVSVKEKYNKYIITVPHAKILGTPNIDPNSIEFRDEKKAVINWDKHDDVAEALQKAKEDINDNPSIDMALLLDRADDQAEELVHTLLDDAVEKDVVVRFKDAE